MKFLKSLKRQAGFTLVELMVVVAIIGLLSAVAIPNFKKYQAKAKVSEAKLQLSGLYMAMTSFFSDFNTFAGCLPYMGYNPRAEAPSRYYGIGWTDAPKVPDIAYTGAINSGINTVNCPATASGNTANEWQSYFPPGKGSGAVIADITHLQGTAYDTVNGLTFTAGAAGVIDGAKTLATGVNTGSSALTVTETKLLMVVQGREGY